MSVERQHARPAPPPKLDQVRVEHPSPKGTEETKTGLVQRSPLGVYIAVQNAYWPPEEARAIAEGILEILDGPAPS